MRPAMLAIKDGKLKLNPFAAIAPKRKDKLKRQPLSAADMKAIKSNLGDLSASDQLLVRLLRQHRNANRRSV